MNSTEVLTPAQSYERYRSIWISDVHLGTPGCKAEYLVDFLKYNESEYLYLVGDIIDGWQLKRGWYWRQSHNDVIQKILRKSRKGTRVVYIAGNHDEALRSFTGMAFGDIAIVDEATHDLLNGKKLWITHGDLFDGLASELSAQRLENLYGADAEEIVTDTYSTSLRPLEQFSTLIDA